MKIQHSSDIKTRLPNFIIYGVVLVCLAPSFLNLLGFDFGIERTAEDIGIRSFHGAIIHTILEWSAVVVALFIAIFSFINFGVKKQITTPIIGCALLAAGVIDAFHTLAADQLIQSATESSVFIPFTWALCRIFNVTIHAVGLGLFLFYLPVKKNRNLKTVLIFSALLTVALAWLMQMMVTYPHLPQTTFPDALVTRPYDLIPLVLFALSGYFLYLPFYKRFPSIFSHAVLLSVLPDFVTEAHMAFGSSALYDNHFMVAHFLKIVAYLIPLIGLGIDYLEAHRAQQHLTLELQRKVQAISRSKVELEKLNAELEQFAFIASHDLKTPLRHISGYVDIIDKELKKQTSTPLLDKSITYVKAGVRKMGSLIEDLLSYSQLQKSSSDIKPVNCNEVVQYVNELLTNEITTTQANIKYGQLPTINADKAGLTQLFQNLLGNAIKYRQKQVPPEIQIDFSETLDHWQFRISDNGMGIPPHLHDSVFQIFRRAHTDANVEGTGIGLALCSKIVDFHKGNIWVENNSPHGSVFYFTISKKIG